MAAAVNRAYDKGVIVVKAAGNNWYQGVQQLAPKSVLYPARFERVIAVTGACYDGSPYDNEAPRNNNMATLSASGEVMQGNWGPESVMGAALAAYTPNLFWANDDAAIPFLKSGGGTSSATPQVAAAAALWLTFNRDDLAKLNAGKPWQKVEAVRKALFSTASKAYPKYKKYYGNGIVRAFKALSAFTFSQPEIDRL
jgi:subtilisin family serine protease